ncbi:hypothetical protein GUITHDRAFT_152912 [Guillardia theta CCMP2712]|uniref:RWP-RK domain-containing protein n=1 Tax=Guillardia theta (strain CCMP2712) TaxID=905079 RepID=L1J7T9_GUITC|nr:hypothetical protein GUITHDRAFT_152912 [Guillardia theta CCMP2712]EKX44596.1 hypothetical protein GUITHDRAFT_152912 [Guillardia theta CCMP2712]|eukprot:XP_005831576.1 hypothetical protein GUITHDRAFT_152912 [Guillardia theta CCMP2712]
MDEHIVPHFVSPRRTPSQHLQHRKPKVVLTVHSLRALFHLRQPDAARALGISLTALKNACKRLRVGKWPYKRLQPGDQQADKEGCRGAASPESSSLDEMPAKLEDSVGEEPRGSGWLGRRMGLDAESLLEEAMMHVSR